MSPAWKTLAMALALGAPACGGSTTSEKNGTESESPLVGTWLGYVENHQFPSGSDSVRLVITNDQLLGRVAFGQGVAPPPPTDPEVGYPPGASQHESPNELHEGFEYTLREPQLDGARFRFEVAAYELYAAWCLLLTPYPVVAGADVYGCLPNWGSASGDQGCTQIDPETGESVSRDCRKLELCNGGEPVCSCTATTCSVVEDATLSFDLDLQADSLDGSMDALGGLKNVHLDRQ